MATNLRNTSSNLIGNISDAGNLKIGIVISEWHTDVTESLFNGALTTLLKHGVKEENIIKHFVPGSFELSLGAQFLAEYTDVDAVICFGCVIQGETPHFTFVCESVTQGITALNLKYNKPFIFGVLTTNTLEQAIERSGGKLGNKGDDCALAALKMIEMKNDLAQ